MRVDTQEMTSSVSPQLTRLTPTLGPRGASHSRRIQADLAALSAVCDRPDPRRCNSHLTPSAQCALTAGSRDLFAVARIPRQAASPSPTCTSIGRGASADPVRTEPTPARAESVAVPGSGRVGDTGAERATATGYICI